MAVKLFVGSLAYTVDSAGLSDLFSQAGKVVSSNVITDRGNGQSKGFGFVEMDTDKEAQAAIKMLNNKDVSGRQLAVSLARPKESGRSGGRF